MRARELTAAVTERPISRRNLFKLSAGALAASSLGAGLSACARGATPVTPATPVEGGLAVDLGSYPYRLPELGYAYGALEPTIDAETMELHHQEHHQTYVDNLNDALAPFPRLHDSSLTRLLSVLSEVPEEIRRSVRNDGGGHLNHALWWAWIEPGGARTPTSTVSSLLSNNFGSYEAFQETFSDAATGVFGSGWAWLVVDGPGNLRVTSTPNQDSPVMEGSLPILGLDVWEHAYYLSYRNRRTEYIDNFWNIVNWDAVERSYLEAEAALNTMS